MYQVGARSERHHARAGPAARIEQHLQRPPVAEEGARQRRERAREAEPHHLDPDAERGERGACRHRRRAGDERGARDLVARREQAQMVIGAELIAAPGRHREACHQEEHPHAASQCLVLAACRQMPAIAPRR